MSTIPEHNQANDLAEAVAGLIAGLMDQPMRLVELVPHLRERAARTSRLDDVAVSKAELLVLLDALEGKP